MLLWEHEGSVDAHRPEMVSTPFDDRDGEIRPRVAIAVFDAGCAHPGFEVALRKVKPLHQIDTLLHVGVHVW